MNGIVNKKHGWVVGSIVLGVGLISGGASADAKLVHASICNSKYPDVDNVYVSQYGFRSDVNDLAVYCPLVKEKETGSLTEVSIGMINVVSGPGEFWVNSVKSSVYARSISVSGYWDKVSGSELPISPGDTITYDSNALSSLANSSAWSYVVFLELDDGDRVGGIYYEEN